MKKGLPAACELLASSLQQLQIYISSPAEGLTCFLEAGTILFISTSSMLPRAQGSAHIMADAQ